MNKTYIQIEEKCGNEGEDWTTFLVEQGNESFIEKLKATIEKFPDLEGDDSCLLIIHEHIPENEVNIILKYLKYKGGYTSAFRKCDDIINPKVIKYKNADAFIESFYKKSYFQNLKTDIDGEN
jgi:hypothetical protein